MGRIAEVLSVERVVADGVHVREVRCDPGGGAAITAQQFACSGDDSEPLPGDFAMLEDSAGAGTETVVGYHDPKNEQKAVGGERRMYSRGSDGVPVAEFWMKTTGEVLIKVLNAAAISIESEGTVHVKSPDVRLGTAPGRKLALVGDMVMGTLHALCASPSSPLAPNPAPVPGAGVPFVAKITGPGSSAASG
jgi:hypothetical protein